MKIEKWVSQKNFLLLTKKRCKSGFYVQGSNFDVFLFFGLFRNPRIMRKMTKSPKNIFFLILQNKRCKNGFYVKGSNFDVFCFLDRNSEHGKNDKVSQKTFFLILVYKWVLCEGEQLWCFLLFTFFFGGEEENFFLKKWSKIMNLDIL